MGPEINITAFYKFHSQYNTNSNIKLHKSVITRHFHILKIYRTILTLIVNKTDHPSNTTEVIYLRKWECSYRSSHDVSVKRTQQSR